MTNNAVVKRRIALRRQMVFVDGIMMDFAFHANLRCVNGEIVMVEGGNDKHRHQNY